MDFIINNIKIMLILGFGLPLAFFDIRQQRLPLALNLPALGTALAARCLLSFHVPQEMLFYLASGLGGLGFVLIVRRITHGGIGKGDGITLAFLGLLLGGGQMITSLLIGTLSALAVWGGLKKVNKAGEQTRIPFGPFLLAGGLITAVSQCSLF